MNRRTSPPAIIPAFKLNGRYIPTANGITGTFTFDEHHDPVKQTAILTYVDGKPVLKEMF